MENFTFHTPTRLVFGKGVFDQIGENLAADGMRQVLLLAGGGSIRHNGVYDQVITSLRQAGVEWQEVWGVRPNPELAKVEEASRICREQGLEAVLAVGGGSVGDSAKCVAAGRYLERPWDAFIGAAPIEKALPLYMALTLSATGTEMNTNAVLSNDREQRKWAISSPLLFPRISYIDPAVQCSLPWKQTVNGAMDALSHILEYLVLGTTEETAIALNEALSRSIIAMTDRLQENEADEEARANLAWAATLALNGVSGGCLKGGDWAVHMMEHALSARHIEISHGEGLAVLFPAFLLYMAPHNQAQFDRYGRNVWQGADVADGVACMRARLAAWGHPVYLDDLGIDRSEIAALASKTLEKDPRGVLKPMTREDIEGVLALAFRP